MLPEEKKTRTLDCSANVRLKLNDATSKFSMPFQGLKVTTRTPERGSAGGQPPAPNAFLKEKKGGYNALFIAVLLMPAFCMISKKFI